MLASSRLLTSRQVAIGKAVTATSALPASRQPLLQAQSLSTAPALTPKTRSSVAIVAPTLPPVRKLPMAAAASLSSAAPTAVSKDKTVRF
jgi:hypothetical protein